MTGIDSDYPAALDPAPVTLRGGHDFLTLTGLQWALAQLTKIQTEVGLDPTLFTGINALHYGLVSSMMEKLFQIEGGTETVTGTDPDVYPVTFTAGRFSAPPFVKMQFKSPTSTEPSQYGVYNAKNITKDGFEIGSHYTNGKTISGETVMWIAIQPLFGLENREG